MSRKRGSWQTDDYVKKNDKGTKQFTITIF